MTLRPDTRRDVIESEGARGTYCGNCGIAYVALFTDLGNRHCSHYLMLRVRHNDVMCLNAVMLLTHLDYL